jgi:large-conductance mechanosensitive channel
MTSSPPLLTPRIFVEFSGFLREYNLVALGLAFLIGQSSLELSRSFIKTTVLPLVGSALNLKLPSIDASELLTAFLTFIVTMFIAFILVRALRVDVKPLPIVQVANSK